MSNVVFILGAGASADCGAPLMNGFLDIASDLLRRKDVDDRSTDFENVFRVRGLLQQVHSKAQLDLNNIESLFTVLELARVIQKLPGVAVQDIPAFIASLKQLIVTTLEKTIRFPCEHGQILPPSSYLKFAQAVRRIMEARPERSVSVITFNYDIAVDVALHKEGLCPDYIVEPAPSAVTTVPLHKLHGSLNWGTESGSRAIKVLRLEKYFSYILADPASSVTRVPIGSQLQSILSKCGVVVDPDPIIVPPSWNKADYHEALSNVWASAANHLSDAEYIFILGYSLPETDAFFRHLYALGSVGDSLLRRFVVFNPDGSGETNRRFEALLGPGAKVRYQYIPHPFSNAVGAFESFIPGVT